MYDVQLIDEGCLTGLEGNFSESREFSNAIFGDTVKDLSFTPPPPPDGSVSIIDAFALVGAWQTAPGAIRKYRAEMEPKCPDLKIAITDILDVISALQGLIPLNSTPDDPDVCNSGCHHSTSLAMAKSFRGAYCRLHPSGLPGSCRCLQ